MATIWVEEVPGVYVQQDDDSALGEDTHAKRLRQMFPNEVASGIPGLRLETKDHIVLFVLSETDAYVSLIADFIAAGLHDTRYQEVCTLELAPKRTHEEAEQILVRAAKLTEAPPMDIVTWEVGTTAYAGMRFSDKAMNEAFHDPMYTVRARTRFTPHHCIRIASEDASQFVRNLTNPRHYLKYEARLGPDLHKSFSGTPFLQLCMYRLEDLLAEDADGRVSLADSILLLLISHNRVIVVDEDDGVLFGNAARKRMLTLLSGKRIPFRSWPYFVLSWLRALLTVDRPSLLERIQYAH